jgi:hypothetical protein
VTTTAASTAAPHTTITDLARLGRRLAAELRLPIEYVAVVVHHGPGLPDTTLVAADRRPAPPRTRKPRAK